ncbi:MAG: hypothetical protein ACOC2L_00810, partial [Candidatus Sumerlaeota bacterium]
MQSNPKQSLSRRSSRSDRLIQMLLVASLVLHIAGAYVFYRWDDLRYSVMRYDPDAVEELSEQAQKREEERKKREQEKRERTEIKKEDAQKIMEEEERRKKAEIRKQIEELRRQKDELENLVEEKREELVERDLDDLQGETPGLTPREKFEILKNRTTGLGDDNADLEQLIDAMHSLSDHRRRDAAEQLVANRRSVETQSGDIVEDLGKILLEERPQIGALAMMLGDFSRLQDTSWKQAQNTATLRAFYEREVRNGKERVEAMQKALRARGAGETVEHKDYRNMQKEDLEDSLERTRKHIEKSDRSLQKDMAASRQAHAIAREAMEINQLALRFLIEHLAENLEDMSAREMYEMAKMLEE